MAFIEEDLPKKVKDIIKPAEDAYAKKVFGDKYGKKNDALSRYEMDIYNDADVKGGLFSLGNTKLADGHTLIINFTSALGCPSMNACPVTQQACYAIAGENRFKNTKRKNLIVQNLVRHAKFNNMIDGLFDIAELYIVSLQGYAQEVHFIRYNEAGDFTDQELLVKCAQFSKKVREKYGVMSMAYTANPKLDPSQEVDGEPIDTIIAINRSRNDIKVSSKGTDRHYFATPMDNFSTNPDINLENAYTDVEYVTDANLQQLQVKAPVCGKYGIPSVPKLTKGTWDGGSGWYYVCPCSFWAYNKSKAAKEWLVERGLIDPNVDLPNNSSRRTTLLKKMLSPEDYKKVKDVMSKIKSPCGVQCAVCHDTEGGITPDGQIVRNYSVLSATHGAGAGNYDAEYAAKKRNGDDTAIYKGNKNNPHGLDNFYVQQKQKYNNKYSKTDAPINNNLFTREDETNESRKVVKTMFEGLYKRYFGNLM